MSLTWPVVAAVLFGALLHASWNALIKSGSDKSLDTALIHVMGCVVAVPLVTWAGLPLPAAWPWLAASIVIHIGYYIALAGAYRHGDLGFSRRFGWHSRNGLRAARPRAAFPAGLARA